MRKLLEFLQFNLLNWSNKEDASVKGVKSLLFLELNVKIVETFCRRFCWNLVEFLSLNLIVNLLNFR